MMPHKIEVPVAYQGGKQRLSSAICDKIALVPGLPFHDLCCGSGAIAIEIVNRGHAPHDIAMLDDGVWGLVWQHIGAGTFDLAIFHDYCDAIPPQPNHIYEYMKELADQDIEARAIPYIFLLLQAASFGGRAVWRHADEWHHAGFRQYWLPTATSNRRSPVNPMMPMPATLYERVARLCDGMYGVHGLHRHLHSYIPLSGVAYIDPPYEGTTTYGPSWLMRELLMSYLQDIRVPHYVSESTPLSDTAWCLSEGQAKGGISGVRKKAHAEYLSLCQPNHSMSGVTHDTGRSTVLA